MVEETHERHERVRVSFETTDRLDLGFDADEKAIDVGQGVARLLNRLVCLDARKTCLHSNLSVKVVAELPEPFVRQTGQRLFHRSEIHFNPLDLNKVRQVTEIRQTRLAPINQVSRERETHVRRDLT